MSTSDESSKAEFNIQILSPVRRNDSTKERLFGRQSSFSSSRVALPYNEVSLGTGENNWWVWGGSRYSGLVCMVISSVAYSFMGLFVKLLSGVSIPHKCQISYTCSFFANSYHFLPNLSAYDEIA